MMDGIIKADGTSRLMRATLPPTYEEFRAQCATGTQPLDVLFNALGWSQLPTFLNKANLVKDATAALFGFDGECVPDNVLSWIGQYNTHWWSVLYSAGGFGYNEKRTLITNATYLFGAPGTSMGTSSRDIYYSDEVNINQETGVVSLKNPSTITLKGRSSQSTTQTACNNLIGKYVSNLQSDSNGTDISARVYYFPSDVAISVKASSGAMYEVIVYAKENGSRDQIYRVTSQVYNIPAGETTYVNSIDRNAYPDSGAVDGLVYQYLGIPFYNAVTAPKVEVGTYVGTGVYPVTLTFNFSPQFLFIFTPGYTSTPVVLHKDAPRSAIIRTTGSSDDSPSIKVEGNSITFRSGYTNENGKIYYCFAVGI